MIDLSFIKNLVLKIDVRNELKKGNVDKVYKAIYELAQDLASKEASAYNSIKTAEELGAFTRSTIGLDEAREPGNFHKSIIDNVLKPSHEFKLERLTYHVNNMIDLLKLSTQMMIEDSKADSKDKK